MGVTNYAASRFWRHALSKTATWDPVHNAYAAMLKSWREDDTAAQFLDEQDGDGYARQLMSVENRGSGRFANLGSLNYGPASVRWDPSLATGILDDLSAGNLLAFAPHRPHRGGNPHMFRPSAGQTLGFPTGALQLNFAGRKRRPVTPADFSECFAWTHGGRRGENLVLEHDGSSKYLIKQALDQGPRGNHFKNLTGDREAGFRYGVSFADNSTNGTYETWFPLIGIHEWDDDDAPFGTTHFSNVYYWDQQFNASGPFHLVAVFANSRNGGSRDLWGAGTFSGGQVPTYVKLDQGPNGTLKVAFDGGGERVLVDSGIPQGLVVLEIYRTASNHVHAIVNGEDVTDPGFGQLVGDFAIDGFGYRGYDASDPDGGQFQWDDYLMELAAFDALPSESDREALREYCTEKWVDNFQERPFSGSSEWFAEQMGLHILGVQEYVPPSKYFAALISQDPEPWDTGATIDEASWSGYSRREIQFSDDPSSDGIGSNSNGWTWTLGEELTRIPAAIAITTASGTGAGDFVGCIPLEGRNLRLRAGDTIRIDAGDLTFNLNHN